MKTNRAKLIKKLDELWSKKVRERDNKCILCGKYIGQPEKLQAHHWIITRARSLKYRWDLRNGVSLCYGCHICQVHHNPSVDLMNRLYNLAILNKVATINEVDEILLNSTAITKLSIKDLEQKLEELNEENNLHK